jgi:hypothetical protein
MPASAPATTKRDAEAAQTEPVTKNSPPSSATPVPDDIARLAYALWQERGCPDGSAERDWLEAEQELRESSMRAAPEMIRG